MANRLAQKRLMKEFKDMMENPSHYYTAAPLDDNIYEFHFTLRGPSGTPYAGGKYHGKLIMPTSYPFAPPDFIMLTPSGRFETHTKICLSISSAYHPENWQPSITLGQMLEAIRILFAEDAGGVGAIQCDKSVRERLASESCGWSCSVCGITNEDLLPGPDPDMASAPTAGQTATVSTPKTTVGADMSAVPASLSEAPLGEPTSTTTETESTTITEASPTTASHTAPTAPAVQVPATPPVTATSPNAPNARTTESSATALSHTHTYTSADTASAAATTTTTTAASALPSLQLTAALPSPQLTAARVATDAPTHTATEAASQAASQPPRVHPIPLVASDHSPTPQTQPRGSGVALPPAVADIVGDVVRSARDGAADARVLEDMLTEVLARLNQDKSTKRSIARGTATAAQLAGRNAIQDGIAGQASIRDDHVNVDEKEENDEYKLPSEDVQKALLRALRNVPPPRPGSCRMILLDELQEDEKAEEPHDLDYLRQLRRFRRRYRRHHTRNEDVVTIRKSTIVYVICALLGFATFLLLPREGVFSWIWNLFGAFL